MVENSQYRENLTGDPGILTEISPPDSRSDQKREGVYCTFKSAASFTEIRFAKPCVCMAGCTDVGGGPRAITVWTYKRFQGVTKHRHCYVSAAAWIVRSFSRITNMSSNISIEKYPKRH